MHGTPFSSARNKETGAKVAIKKICPMSASDADAKHTLREIRLMRYLGRHENVSPACPLCVRNRLGDTDSSMFCRWYPCVTCW